jgi:hypothetical protein
VSVNNNQSAVNSKQSTVSGNQSAVNSKVVFVVGCLNKLMCIRRTCWVVIVAHLFCLDNGRFVPCAGQNVQMRSGVHEFYLIADNMEFSS